MSRPSIGELQHDLGVQLRNARVRLRMDQKTLAAAAGISRMAVSRLERGEGGQVHTFLAVIRELGELNWLSSLAPTIDVQPLLLLRARSRNPQRVKRTKEEIREEAKKKESSG